MCERNLHCKNIVFISILLQFINNVYCCPIEVTGKNIKYYKLTPNEGSGSYNFDYGTKDGAQRSERGFVKHDPNSPEPLLVVTGSYKHPDANEVFYIADEQGYRIVSKEEIDELHSKLPNEIFPTTAKDLRKSGLSSTLHPVNDGLSSTLRPGNDGLSSTLRPVNDGLSSTLRPESDGLSSNLRPENDGLSFTLRPGNDGLSSTLRPENDGLSTALRPENDGLSSTLRPVKIFSARTLSPPLSRTPKTYFDSSDVTRPPVQIPVTESRLIKVNIIQPVNKNPVTCAPGKCSGARESKNFKIKPIKFG